MKTKKRKVKIKWKNFLLCAITIVFAVVLISKIPSLIPKKNGEKEVKMVDLSLYKREDIKKFCKENDLSLTIEYQYSRTYQEGMVISQSILVDTPIKKDDSIKVVISKGEVPSSIYLENKVNELGNIPIMMYHGIIDMKSIDTKYTGGNVDKDGYNRTSEAFIKDLEFYYQNGYRMIRLIDYVEGNIDVELGKSPIVLTFDDGREDSIKVTGLDEKGEIIIDPNSAVGILEQFKKKYPDFHVTATFFVNSSLFNQKEYNEKILKWLVENGYDVGNHSMSHPDFSKINTKKAQEEIGGVYKILEEIIPNQYVKIVALPFGSPYKKSHENFPFILNGDYEGTSYQSISSLRVGWDSETSPFIEGFDASFLKRIRAYDNNGKEFDIDMCFRLLEKNRYISDGDKTTIVYKKDPNVNIQSQKLDVIAY